jgi:hypothetical protein
MYELFKVLNINDFLNYEISNLGNIRNIKTKRLLKQFKDRRGYCRVELSSNSKTKKYSIHRLVAQTFISNPQNKPEVNHKDGNKANNNVENLEWVTAKENIIHSFKFRKKYTFKNKIIEIYNTEKWKTVEDFYKALIK